MNNILLIEDDMSINKILAYELRKKGYLVDSLYDGKEAVSKILENDYDLVLIDWMLPYKDGVSIIKEVRQNDYVKPLILLTARSEQEDIIKGLEAGADDYLTKPFQSAVLIARIEAHLRRHHKHFLDEIKFEDVMMNTKNREVTIDNHVIVLTKVEYDLLKMLEISLEEGFPIIPRKFTVVKTKEIETLIDRIYASLPVEVQEARAFLRRREELQIEAQQKAEKIIQDAQAEADRKLSEADFIKALEREGIRIRTQVQQECEEIKRKAMEEADNIRAQAVEEAMKTKEGAELYAEQVLTNLEKNLTQQQQIVKNGQVYMEKLRTDSFGSYDIPTSYSTERAQSSSDFVIK